MVRRNRYITSLVVVVAVTALMLVLTGAAVAAGPTVVQGALTVALGETYIVEEITHLDSLTIAEGGIVKAATGFSVTLTVDSVETGGEIYTWPTGIFDPAPPFAPPGSPDSERYAGETRIKPGTYQGDIVLTPTVEMLLPRGAPFPAGNEPYEWPYRTALYISDSGVVANRSVMSAVKGGSVSATSAENLVLASTGDYFNGVMVDGDTTYTLTSPNISFTGNGHDDFGGFGAAVRVKGTSDVTIDDADIVTDGVVRSAVWVGDDAKVTVNDSTIETGLGILPADWLGGPFPPGTGGSMLTVPWMLGISGNCRATSVVAKGEAFYNNTHIKAQQWGALSTDMCFGASLTAKDCTIEVVESGYGAYSDMQVNDTFDHCTFNVPDYGLIQTGPGTTIFTNGTVVNSQRWGVMFHGGAPGTVNIKNGSVFRTGLTTFLMKSSYPTINADRAQLTPGNGIILHAMLSDDAMSPDQSGGDTNIDANFSNMRMTGDIVNTNTAKCNVNVALANTTLFGAITTGTQEFLGTYPRTPEDRDDIGMVKATYGPTADQYGVNVVVNSGGNWRVTKTSYLDSLRVNRGGNVHGHVTVDGAPTMLRNGVTYTGEIVVTAL